MLIIAKYENKLLAKITAAVLSDSMACSFCHITITRCVMMINSCLSFHSLAWGLQKENIPRQAFSEFELTIDVELSPTNF